jgi:hypothetical protein
MSAKKNILRIATIYFYKFLYPPQSGGNIFYWSREWSTSPITYSNADAATRSKSLSHKRCSIERMRSVTFGLRNVEDLDTSLPPSTVDMYHDWLFPRNVVTHGNMNIEMMFLMVRILVRNVFDHVHSFKRARILPGQKTNTTTHVIIFPFLKEVSGLQWTEELSWSRLR